MGLDKKQLSKLESVFLKETLKLLEMFDHEENYQKQLKIVDKLQRTINQLKE
jgi:hypothetical protein